MKITQVFVLTTLLLLSSLSFANNNSIEKSDWLTDIETATAQAKTDGKHVLILFTGSDWCKPCMLLKRDILNSESFQKFAKEQLILVKADFPAHKRNKLSKEQTTHNEQLAEKYNPDGTFPLLVVLDSEGDLIGDFGYEKDDTPKDHIEYLEYLLSDEE